MIVYDIVQHVKPGTHASYPAGRWHAGTLATEDRARQVAAIYNQNVMVDGILYNIEPHDEECGGRAPHYREKTMAGDCSCLA